MNIEIYIPALHEIPSWIWLAGYATIAIITTLLMGRHIHRFLEKGNSPPTPPIPDGINLFFTGFFSILVGMIWPFIVSVIIVYFVGKMFSVKNK